MLAPRSSPRFYMYTSPQLDFGWLRFCKGFEEMMRTPYHERLGEVHMRDLLESHPWRTRQAHEALLFFVPVWEVASFRLGTCNGTTHDSRMARAGDALKASPHFRGPRGRRPGFDHFIVSTGCIEEGKRAAERLGPGLAYALGHAIVGRDRAYNAFYKSSAVGRCVIETPYVANSAETEDGGGERRRWLLSFHGSLDVCCEPGKGLRQVLTPLPPCHILRTVVGALASCRSLFTGHAEAYRGIAGQPGHRRVPCKAGRAHPIRAGVDVPHAGTPTGKCAEYSAELTHAFGSAGLGT